VHIDQLSLLHHFVVCCCWPLAGCIVRHGTLCPHTAYTTLAKSRRLTPSVLLYRSSARLADLSMLYSIIFSKSDSSTARHNTAHDVAAQHKAADPLVTVSTHSTSCCASQCGPQLLAGLHRLS
jgi:hypothetical protein